MLITLGNNQRGLTFLEVLLSLSLVLIIINGLMSCFYFAYFSQQRLLDYAELQYNARQAGGHLLTDIRNSQGAYIRYEGKGQSLHLVYEGEYIDYYCHNGQLYRDSSKSPPIPVAQNISEVYFLEPAGGLIALKITAKTGECSYIYASSCKSALY